MHWSKFVAADIMLLPCHFSRVRLQPARFPHPWGSPGKNTGVGCHFLLQCRKVKRESEVAQSCLTLSNPMECSLPGSSVHGIFQARILEWVTVGFSGYLATLVHFICQDGCVFYLQNSVSLKLCPRLWLSS